MDPSEYVINILMNRARKYVCQFAFQKQFIQSHVGRDYFYVSQKEMEKLPANFTRKRVEVIDRNWRATMMERIFFVTR